MSENIKCDIPAIGLQLQTTFHTLIVTGDFVGVKEGGDDGASVGFLKQKKTE
jgi:hypothetical protein